MVIIVVRIFLFMFVCWYVGGESGSADTARDPRGFAVKFYTEQGNWDCVGNNTPIFFIRDPIHVCMLIVELGYKQLTSFI